MKNLTAFITCIILSGFSTPQAAASLAPVAPDKLCESKFKLDNNSYMAFSVSANSPYVYHLINEVYEESPFEVSEYLAQISSDCPSIDPSDENDGLYDYSMTYSSNVCPTWILIDHDLTGFYEVDEPFLMHIDAYFFEGVGNPGFVNIENIPDFKKRFVGSCREGTPFYVNQQDMDVYTYRTYLSEKVGQFIVRKAIDAGWDKETLQQNLLPENYNPNLEAIFAGSTVLPKILYKTETNLWCFDNNPDDCNAIREAMESVYALDAFYSSECRQLWLKPQHIILQIKLKELISMISIENDIPDYLLEHFKDESWEVAQGTFRKIYSEQLVYLKNSSSSERDNGCSESLDTDINNFQGEIDKFHRIFEENFDELSPTQLKKYEDVKRKPKKRSF